MKRPLKTFHCDDHNQAGGPVRLYRSTTAEQQANRVARTLARRLYGRDACYTQPRLLSINPSDLRRHYGCHATDKAAFFSQPVVFSILTPTE